MVLLALCINGEQYRVADGFTRSQLTGYHLKIYRYQSTNQGWRVFAPNFGITKKEHNDMAYEAAKQELEARRSQLNAPGKKFEQNMVKQ